MSYRLPILYLDLCIPSILTWYQNFMQGCFSSKKGSKGSHIPKFGVSCIYQNWMYGNWVRPCNLMTKQESIVRFISIIFEAEFYFSFLLVLCIQIFYLWGKWEYTCQILLLFIWFMIMKGNYMKHGISECNNINKYMT